jgi:Flp pilus assembly protein TadG
MGVVSAAIDYSMMIRIKAELQAAVDGSVLAAANDFTVSLETKDLDTTGQDYFDGNFNATDLVTDISYDLDYGASTDTTDDDEVTGL